MQYEIKAPQVLNQTIKLPASKSISNRALIIHALSGGVAPSCQTTYRTATTRR